MKPYAGRKLFVEPGHAAEQAETWKTSDPEGSRLMAALAKIPDASWIGEWEHDPRKWTDDLLTRAGSALCVLAIYAIPQRDCGSLSAGGVHDAAGYRAFVGELAVGVKGREAIVVLEPDGLTVIGCLSASQLAERHALLAGAVDVLTAAGAKVYIDCGDSDWVPAATVAAALKASGVARAAGFALNVSHFELTKNEHAFAREIRALLAVDGIDAHYVIDTSRNGTGPHGSGDNRWCNPPDVGCGRRPTLNPKTKGCDALLWVKSVGGSDGAKFGGPAAGQWWPEFARRLCKAAVPPLVTS